VETAALEATHGLCSVSDLDRDIHEIKWEFEQPSEKIAVLTSAIKRVKGRVDDSGIECHQTHFSSKQDFLAWCTDRNVSVACFCDAMALMNAVGALVMFQEDATKMKADQKKIGINTRLEAAAITSFDTVVP